jgi:hypothetical protein
MAKFRSKTDYSQIYSGTRGGMNLGIDGAIFLKTESVQRTFQAPSIGTQGQSLSAVSADTDISAGSDNALKIAVDGGAVVDVVLVQAGKTTGLLIAAELESKINAALLAAGQDGRVWVSFNGAGPDQYTVYSQSTGAASSVVITDATVNNVADDLKLGVPNAGTETVGTDDTDFLLYTSGGPTFSQPIESNAHRSGRFHTGIVKAKKVVEWNASTYVNMSGTAGDSIDPAVRLLWKSLLGTEEVVASTAIRYRQGLPAFTFSLVRVSTIFAEYYTGCYVKDMTMTFPGDGPATCEWSGMGSTRKIAGIAKLSAGVTADDDLVLQAGETDRFDVGAPVMVVDADGRTILAGADGSLLIDAISSGTALSLSANVTALINSYLVPWHPGAVQQSGRDAIFTDLVGSFKLKSAGASICATNISLTFTNDHVDLSNCFGVDHNEGFAAANRLTMTLAVTLDLSNENFAEVVQSQTFAGFDPEIILGSASGRNLKITAPKWIPAVPAIEVPENGITPITLEGQLYQSAPGAQDPVLVQFR